MGSAVKRIDAPLYRGDAFSRQPGNGPAMFKKDVLRVGTWVHPYTKRKVEVTAERLNRIADGTRKFIERKNPVALPARHSWDPKDNLGFVRDVWVDGDRLHALIEVPEARDAERFGVTIRHVSPYLERDVIEPSTGEVLSECMTHLACVSDPVINGQENFIRLSRGDDVVSVVPLISLEESMSFETIARAVGLSATASEADIVVAVTEARRAQREAEALSAKLAEKDRQVEALAAKLEAASAKLAGLEEQMRQAREAEALSFLDELKRKSAAAGSPIAQDRLDRIKAHFDAGRDEHARELGQAYLDVALASTSVGAPAEKPGESAEALSRRQTRMKVLADAFAAEGIKVKLSEDGTEITDFVVSGEK